jgi:hypothetical protein
MNYISFGGNEYRFGGSSIHGFFWVRGIDDVRVRYWGRC